jgi:uncharacterized metal-binding protein
MQVILLIQSDAECDVSNTINPVRHYLHHIQRLTGLIVLLTSHSASDWINSITYLHHIQCLIGLIVLLTSHSASDWINSITYCK